jgi:cytoskeletal protein RodZ
MPPDEINFQTFFAAKIKDRGLSIKKLAEITGIAPAHLEAMVHGRFDDLPSAPYVHGYLVRLGKSLDFDGDEWWGKIKKERLVQNSGPADSLPSNRFIRQSPTKFIWIVVVGALVIIYLAFQIPVIFGKPQLTVVFPTANPYTATTNTLTLQGFVRGADSLYLNNGAAGAGGTGGANSTSGNNDGNETIATAPDGSWQKSVLLQNGMNTFQVTAKKLLGGETSVTEQIMYQGGPAIPLAGSSTTAGASSTASSTAAASSTAPTSTR